MRIARKTYCGRAKPITAVACCQELLDLDWGQPGRPYLTKTRKPPQVHCGGFLDRHFCLSFFFLKSRV